MSSDYVTIGTQLLSRLANGTTLEPGQPWDERAPSPGPDGTLLAIVPIPGTQTSLAIVGYAVSTAAEPARLPAVPRAAEPAQIPSWTGIPDRTGPAWPGRTPAACSSTACSAGSGPTTARSR